MSVVQIPPRVANPTMSIDLGNEKPYELLHVDTKGADITVDLHLDGKSVSCVSLLETEAVLALDDKKAANLSQTLKEPGRATDYKASDIHQSVTEADIFPDDSIAVTETCSKILDVIFDYALNKFDNTKERLAAGAPKFLSIIARFVSEGKQVQMCLPAFPFKSANKIHKVLGTLPDKAEELALGRLNSMCAYIGDFYKPGAKLTIISDGLVYNGMTINPQSSYIRVTSLIPSLLTDLLSISDQDTWAYGEALRAMAAQKEFTHLAFSRLQDLVTFASMPERLQEISYIANATNFRRFLFNKYGKEDIDIEQKIATDPDTLMTYRGYCRFLESDLQYIFVTGKDRTIKGYKRDVKYLAKQMLIRGYVSSKVLIIFLKLIKISHARE